MHLEWARVRRKTIFDEVGPRLVRDEMRKISTTSSGDAGTTKN